MNALGIANSTIPSTWNSSVTANGASSTNGGGPFAIATTVSGSTPVATVKIQHSSDNVTYVDLVTFTNFSAVGSQMSTVADGTTVNRYLRVNYTISGSTPSFDLVVGFGRNG